MKMRLMGTGTSHGVPVIGCNCKVCRSRNPKDHRLRTSAWITGSSTEMDKKGKIIVDTGPEFRIQAIKYGIKETDAVLYTHSHADHLHGLDDLRVFSHTKSDDPAHPDAKDTAGEGLNIYANKDTYADITVRFDYLFKTVQIGGGKPKLKFNNYDVDSTEEIIVKDIAFRPIPLKHGKLNDSGFLFYDADSTLENRRSIAYLTDLSFIEESSIDAIKKHAGTLEHLVIDGLRIEPHSTHFSFEQAMEVAEKLLPKNTWLTHLTHNSSHKEVKAIVKNSLLKFPELSKIVKKGGYCGPAWDGLCLEI